MTLVDLWERHMRETHDSHRLWERHMRETHDSHRLMRETYERDSHITQTYLWEYVWVSLICLSHMSTRVMNLSHMSMRDVYESLSHRTTRRQGQRQQDRVRDKAKASKQASERASEREWASQREYVCVCREGKTLMDEEGLLVATEALVEPWIQLKGCGMRK